MFLNGPWQKQHRLKKQHLYCLLSLFLIRNDLQQRGMHLTCCVNLRKERFWKEQSGFIIFYLAKNKVVTLHYFVGRPLALIAAPIRCGIASISFVKVRRLLPPSAAYISFSKILCWWCENQTTVQSLSKIFNVIKIWIWLLPRSKQL